MKMTSLIVLALLAVHTWAQDPAPEMNNEKDSLSYFLGLTLGFELYKTPFENNPALILQGFTEAFKNQAPVSEQYARQVFQELQQELREREMLKADREAQLDKSKAHAWMVANGTKEGMHTTASGLQYRVVKEGEGAMPADTSKVRVHYEGRLIDGTVFDSSYERGEPISFPLNRVIAGWTEGLQLMKVGSVYHLFIPPELGYGARGSGSIPPYSVLIFKVELLGIE
jgi:FKBP-type peptidyl-prolyl cis-trans isomerase FkpA/FKBP-type peptidyl-prolyl cis-trans isomerase FklB